MTVPPEGEAGMTLVEILVVLAIIGVAAGAVVLGIGAAARPPSVESEARRLAERLQLAADDVMIDDRGLAFQWHGDGYGFLLRTPGGWRAGEDEGLAYHRLPGSMALSVAGVKKGVRPVGIDGAGQPFSARLDSTAGRWLVAYDGLTVSVSAIAG